MPDHGRGRVHRFRDHVVAGVNWRPTRFVDEVPSSRVCGLCRMIPKRTVVLPCLHALCQSCHAASLEGSVGRCPLDREAFEEGECVGSEFPARKANAVKVYCWNEAHGCEYTGTMDRMLEHYENECTFHTVDCWRCGEGVQHRDLPTHYAAGCSAGASTAITESTEHTAPTLEYVRATLECLNHDQLVPVIQSQLNELTEQARKHEAWLAAISRELGACQYNLKGEIAQIATTISSTVSHQLTSQQNPVEEASTTGSLSLHSGQELILRKLDGLAHLENWRKTSPKPDFTRVTARCEALDGDVRRFTSALLTPELIKQVGWIRYAVYLENVEEIMERCPWTRKFAEITVWHMRDTYFTIELRREHASTDLLVQIKFNGMLAGSKCSPPFWKVTLVNRISDGNELSLTPAAERCSCERRDPSLPHFHLRFTTDIASLEGNGYVHDGTAQFHIYLFDSGMRDAIRGAP